MRWAPGTKSKILRAYVYERMKEWVSQGIDSSLRSSVG